MCANQIDKETEQKKRKLYLVSSVIINFGILFVFKYYNFITESVFNVLDSAGVRVHFPEFKLLLPVGISFYTFQAVGYTIDVYRKELKHETHFGKYALFVSFFPQLVAGPIERATNLLPQFRKEIKFDYRMAIDGTKLIIWGYFMKVVVADRMAVYTDTIYSNIGGHSAITIIVGTIFFAFQIYCDFGGYSSIAIGCAKIMGFDLMTNFKRPYFAQTPVEFWRRWHISLSTWFKDYVYIPLGGNRVSKTRKYYNLFITFLVSGLWHGANWTFVIWGGVNGIYQIVYSILNIKPSKNVKNVFVYLFNISTNFVLICFSWIFFRANSMSDAITAISRTFTAPGKFFMGDEKGFVFAIIGLVVLLGKDTYDEFLLEQRLKPKKIAKGAWYLGLVMLILLIGVFDGGQFIYFQF
ncbi:MBOAT family O-acyltransferase [Neptunitalea chrysea]|uniref:MBOAT family O-acyltransferase n=1 Tax=Neptunitalea chrysea TaxID=1647581 RepID=UPI00248F628C|nr:MBOAT family O-acyltransferase [Neptunitalea chrysea]